MARSLAHSAGSASAGALAAAKARHPAGHRLRAGASPAGGFADAVSLLTGPWRVGDPDGFARAMTHAPTIDGHPVTDLTNVGDLPGEAVTGTLAALAARPELRVWWVSGVAAGHLHVEARAQAPVGAGQPKVLVLAHLLEPLDGAGRPAPPVDHSWVLVVIGDRSGGVATVARAMLDCPRRPRCCPPPAGSVRFPLAALRARLTSPAIEAEGASERSLAAVLPFRPRA